MPHYIVKYDLSAILINETSQVNSRALSEKSHPSRPMTQLMTSDSMHKFFVTASIQQI